MLTTMSHLKTLIFISIFWCVVRRAKPTVYGPSLVSLTRWDRLVRGPTIFNPDTGRVILLEDYPNYSVVIPLAPESATATSNQVFIARRVSGPGEFTVEAPPGMGVMAVIQSLDLRVAEEACNDFILFSDADGGGVETTGTCGKVDIRDPSPTPQGLIGPRTFTSDSGRMKILFYHGFIWGLVRNFNFDIFDSSLNPDLKVEIVFTAYKDCPSANATNKAFPQIAKYASNNNSFAACSPSVPNSKTCIRKELFCDKNLNCAFGQDFGSDEGGLTCSGSGQSKFSQVLSAKVLSTESTLASSTEKALATENSTTPSTVALNSEKVTLNKINSIVSTSTEKYAVEAKPSSKGTTGGGDASSIGLVKNPVVVERASANRTTIQASVKSVAPLQTIKNQTESKLVTRGKVKSTGRMPLEKVELFVDVKADPEEDPLVNGLTKEEEALLHDDNTMSLNSIIGIVAITSIVLLLMGILRVYYCYNKVIWNPHGSRLKSPSESPPETPDSNLMRKMKALAMESEVYHEKMGKVLKENPPSYEILFNHSKITVVDGQEKV